MFHPVILAGESGELLWPLPRQRRPKQFLTLDGGGRSLQQATVDRLLAVSGSPDALMVVTANEHRSQLLEQLPEFLLVEPIDRDTAAVPYTALTIFRHEPDTVLGLFPTDHRTTDQAVCQVMQAQAINYARDHDVPVTLGIQPNYPVTGYGYIECGQAHTAFEDAAVHYVRRFTEKPASETAADFLSCGTYLWNSGIYIWRVHSILDAFARYMLDLYAQMSEMASMRGGMWQVYPELSKISIEYAMLGHAQSVVGIPSDFGWNALRDCNALGRLL
ncbi:mannose-1-phosphate guanylyltransferase [Deinococcus irradiatisoli]|uniref:Mannose-1-phosphate guanylyltransferase n=1 Tax=Deinococcus irradiatisoli TaxID=2202254 RepID=A0A2Z3JFB6_9DEIO|nr:mannose-1-phosphate guanylyltransferase [Deinococcus irradiatisoli]